MTGPLIVGLGSHHGDDRAGWLIVDRLHDEGVPKDNLRQMRHPAEILDVLDSARHLVICDACQGAGAVGTVHCWSWPTDRILPLRARGTHDMEIHDVLELARGLGMKPSAIEIWGVEGQSWIPGTTMRIEVSQAVEAVAAAIRSKYFDA